MRRQASKARSITCEERTARSTGSIAAKASKASYAQGVRGIIHEGGGIASRQHRDHAPTGQGFDKLFGLDLGLIQQDSARRLIAHAQAVIDENNGMHWLIGISGSLRETAPVGPRQGEAKSQQARYPEQQEKEIPKFHHTPASRYGLAEEVSWPPTQPR